MRRSTIAGMFAAAALLIVPSGVPAGAATTVAFAGPGSYVSTYTTPVVTTTVGGEVLFGVADAQPHDFVARGHYAPVQCPQQPGLCPDGTPTWCRPSVDPNGPWDPFNNTLRFPPGECPLFWTPLIFTSWAVPGNPAGTNPTRVLGLENVVAGQIYNAYCTIHPFMTARLVVAG